MEILKDILNLFIDAERRFSTKAAIFIAILIGGMLANNIFGFTYYYNISNKLEKISAINLILKDSTITANNKLELTRIREEVLERVTIPEAIADRVSNAYAQLKKTNLNAHEDKAASTQSIAIVSPRSSTWFLLSTSGLYIILVIVLLPVGLIAVMQTKEALNGILGLFVVAFVMYGIGAFNYYVLNLLPQFGNSWAWNYALNAVIQISLLALLSLTYIRINKT